MLSLRWLEHCQRVSDNKIFHQIQERIIKASFTKLQPRNECEMLNEEDLRKAYCLSVTLESFVLLSHPSAPQFINLHISA